MAEVQVEHGLLQNGIYGIPKRKTSSPRVACHCCPYGYHIDLDFVRFCEALSKEEPSASKKQRRERRRQRRSMEVLLGLHDKPLWNYDQQLPMIPQEPTPPPPPIRTTSLALGNDGFNKAMLDFEATLERTSKRRSRPDFLLLTDNEESFRSEPSYEMSASQESRNLMIPDYIMHTSQDNSGLDFDVLSMCSVGSNISTKPLQNIREQMAMSLERMKDLEDKVKQLPLLRSQLTALKDEKRQLLLQLKMEENEKKKLNELVKSNREVNKSRRSHSCSRVVEKDSSKSTRDIGIVCNVITRDVAIGCIRQKSKTVATETDIDIFHIAEIPKQLEERKVFKEVTEVDNFSDAFKRHKNKENEIKTKFNVKSKGTNTELKMDDLERESEKKKRISLKELDLVIQVPPKEASVVKVHKAVQVIQECQVLKVVEKRDFGVQIEEVVRKRDASFTVKPMTTDISVDVRQKVKTVGCSDDKIVDVVCDKCKNSKTRSIGVGVGNVMAMPAPTNHLLQLGSQGRSKSFDFSNVSKPKLTRTIGISTLAQVPKLTSSKSTDTYDFNAGRFKQAGVNTIKKKLIDTAAGDNRIRLFSEGEVNICDKCNNDIKNMAKGVLSQIKTNKDGQPSKIPRPKSLSTTPVVERKKYTRQDTYTKISPTSFHTKESEISKSKPRLKTSLEKYSHQTSNEEKLSEKFDVQLRLKSKTDWPASKRHSLGSSFSEEHSHKDQSSKDSRSSRHKSISSERLSSHFEDGSFDYDENFDEMDSKRSSQAYPDNALFQPIQDTHRAKLEPTKEMKAAMKVVNDSLHKYSGSLPKQLKNASNILQEEWFKISSTASANPLDVEDYLDSFEEVSSTLLEFIVNLTDNNGNTAMHYAVSHGNFDVVSILLDSKVCNINASNAAGYTCIMLVSLAQVRSETHRQVVKRLFQLADINIRAKQHGQTALMLAVSHGRLDMVQLLLEAGADPNIQDEDGSTALMCAAEHGHEEIVKHILGHADCDPSIVDFDGSSALAIAMEAGHRDIGVFIYAKAHFSSSRGNSPYTSMRQRRSRTSPSPAGTPTSPAPKRPDQPF